MSATSFGVGRLLVWEDAAVGLQLGEARTMGYWDQQGHLHPDADFAEGLALVQPWAIVRLAERVQVQGWVPVMVNDREVGPQSQVAVGLGDVGAAVRYQMLDIGAYAGLPSLSFTLGGVAPTGTRPEQTRPPLFAGATGRGAWGTSLAIESEYARLPWFVRLDAGFTWSLPFRRTDIGVIEQYGPGFQAALSTGNEVVLEKVVAAVALLGEWEAPIKLAGVVAPDSRAYSVSLAGSVSFRVASHWTLTGILTNTWWPSGLGANRDARLGFTAGIRYGFF
jgi:hypothetical protein